MTGRTGIIIDWQTVSVGAFGLDAGRAAFIALMDLGHSGRPAELWASFIDGYIVAGLQFIHGRFIQPLRPDRTPEAAAAALTQFLCRTR